VRQRQGRHVARHDEANLPVPGGLRADHAVVDLLRGGAEQVRPVAERVGRQERDRLPADQQVGQVVSHHVGQRDRHQRVREGPR
jgi:hypothetical protein